MKRILCYGDSNTWGFVSNSDFERHEKNERFSGIIQERLKCKFDVIEEGLNSRTLVSDDKRKNMEGRNGSVYLLPCLDSHFPIDLVILMLGTNQFKRFYSNTAEEIATQFEENFVKIILNRKSFSKKRYPRLLIISPPLVDETTEWAKDAYLGATSKSQKIPDLYKEIALRNNCYFIDSSDLEVGIDGVHLTKESHKKLAERILEKINKIDF